MKHQIYLAFVSIFFVSSASAQSIIHTSVLFRQHDRSVMLHSGDLASCSIAHPYTAIADKWNMAEDGYKKTRRYKNALQTRNEGIGLTAAGAVCLGGGIPLMAVGIRNTLNDRGSTDLNAITGHIMEYIFGGVIMAGGLGMAIPGPVQLHKGLMHMKKIKETYEP